jgi:hypothetical protein
MTSIANPHARRCALALAIATTLGLPLLAQAGSGTTASSRNEIERAYRHDSAECRAGHTYDALDDCLYEARSVRRDALLGKYDNVDESESTLAANEMQRCERVPQEVLAQCLSLARGEGLREGSVRDGAVLMELTPSQELAQSPQVRP